jgi:RimJ/RimL family protein N-acetyltransferase
MRSFDMTTGQIGVEPLLLSPRLCLVPIGAGAVRLQATDPHRFFAGLGAAVPAQWPPLPFDLDVVGTIAGALDRSPDLAPWYEWVFLTRGAPDELAQVVGAGGFTGPPDLDGEVELGFGILSEQGGRGYASEAVTTLVGWALHQPGCERVVCHTLADLESGARALAKMGFRPDGRGPYPGVDRFLLTA